jgi:hypothetical protein
VPPPEPVDDDGTADKLSGSERGKKSKISYV